MYDNLHGTYKQALQKALQSKLKSLRLIGILEDFANENSKNSKSKDDKENINVFQLKNPKVRRGKGRPVGVKRYKASHEDQGKKTKQQRRCKKCGNLGHYQKNCNAQLIINKCH